MTDINSHDVLAQIRAIAWQLKFGGMSYDQAKEKANPLIEAVNNKGRITAKKYGKKWYNITFSRAMRGI